MADLGDGPDRKFRPQETPPLEWAFAALGCLIVLSVIGFLLLRAAGEEGEPPRVVVRELGRERAGGDFRVDVELENTGRETVQALQVVAELTRGGEELETAEAIVDYLPAGSTREIGFFFREDPDSAELVIRPAGFNYP